MLTSSVILLQLAAATTSAQLVFSEPDVACEAETTAGFELLLAMHLYEDGLLVMRSEPLYLRLDAAGGIPSSSVSIQEWANETYKLLVAKYRSMKGRQSRAETPAPPAPVQTVDANRSLGSPIAGATQI